MQLQGGVQRVGSIAVLKRDQAGGEVVGPLEIEQSLRKGYELLKREILDAG